MASLSLLVVVVNFVKLVSKTIHSNAMDHGFHLITTFFLYLLAFNYYLIKLNGNYDAIKVPCN